MRSVEVSVGTKALQPKNEDEIATIYDVWFATNRAPNNHAELAAGFSNERDPAGTVRYGQCSVEIPRMHERGSLGTPWWKRWLHLQFTDDHLKLRGIEAFGSAEEFASEMRAELDALIETQDRCILLYIHGFNVSFEEAALRAAQIGCDLKVPGATAFFSWPSKAATHAYPADIARVEASETQLSDFLTLLANGCGAATVHVIAHSMGNRGFARAIARATAHASRSSALRFGQIILAAPDMDVDLFRQLASVYPAISKRTTMYVSDKDRALGFSGWLQDSIRAGFTPPITILPGIDTIEVSEIDVTMLGHGYFAAAKPLLVDIQNLLYHSDPPGRRSALEVRQKDAGTYWVFKQ